MQNISESMSSLLLLFLFCLIVSACFFCFLFCCAFSFPLLLLFQPSFSQSLAERAQFLSFFHSSTVCFNKPFSSAPLFVICLNQTACIHPLHFHNLKHLSDLFSQTFTSEAKSRFIVRALHQVNKRAHIQWAHLQYRRGVVGCWRQLGFHHQLNP